MNASASDTVPVVAAEAVPRASWPLSVGLGLALGVFYGVTIPAGWTWAGGPWTPLYTWAAAAGVAILLYLWLAGRGATAVPPAARDVAWAAMLLVAFVADAWAFAPPRLPALAAIAGLHLPVLVWFVIGVVVLGRGSTPAARLAAILKSVEAVVTAGLYVATAGVFGLVAGGLFMVLGVEPAEPVLRRAAALVLGLVVLLGVATVYEPGLPPGGQRVGSGLARLYFIAARLFLLPTLLVLLAVTVMIPTRFGALADSRQTLLVFDAMLFAVMVLLAGATPARADAVTPALAAWLRRGIVAVALLAAVVSGYALAAILSRVHAGGLTVNRFMVLGWNVVNVVTLLWLLVLQLRVRSGAWVAALHDAVSAGLVLYGVWTTFVLVLLPHLARAAHWPLGRP